ncbi:MAG TPA: tRNA epoxyqueuosine(34) reductase QueG [Candidatus Hydrogenedens sp.]|nr:tRNA epoxyqueuosine(34) reductase QueG [Candidatus Hydrogenedens sp.]
MKKYTCSLINNNIKIQKEIKKEIQTLSKELNFSNCGVAEASSTLIPHLREWLNHGYQAGMDWFSKSIDFREDILKWFPEAQSVIVFTYNYYHICNMSPIALYAHGEDYHKVIEDKIKKIIEFLTEIIEDFKFKISIDAGPVHEKSWAVRAGIGWQGKNTLIINTSIGSWFLLGILATNLKLTPDTEIENQCGDCKLCIEACPTKALSKDGYLDCNKCISYHTIENKNDIPPLIQQKIKDSFFGCDICQKVCPWNRNKKVSLNKELCIIDNLNLKMLSEIKEEEFKTVFSKTPIKRVGFKRFQRNIQVYLKNME